MAITQNGALKRDDNDSPVMGGTSSVDNATIINSAYDPVTRRLLTDSSTGSGTVTSVSVVTANGFAGTVATPTTTPAITLTTTVTGVLKGNGTTISTALNSDLPTMTATVGGAVPTPPNNTTTFLRGDGTFASPTGSGTVNAGTAGQLAYYASSSNAVSGNANFTITGSAVTLGVAGSAVGTLLFANATSGTITLTPPTGGLGTVTLTLPDDTDTLVGKATTDTFTNKTYDTAGTGNSFSINGLAATANTGTGAVVRATSPTLVTPVLGVATITSLNGLNITTTTGTLSITSGKTLAVANSLNLAGTDATTMTFPTTSATIARTDTGQTFTGNQTFSGTITTGANGGTGGQITLNGASTGSGVIRVASAAGAGIIFQLPSSNGSNTNVLQTDGSGNTSWVAAGVGTVTSVSVATANGLAGSSSGGATPILTLSTTINSPVLAGNGTAIAAATTTGSGSTVVLSSTPTITTPVLTGLPTGTGVASAATASTLMSRDANANASANSFIEGYTTTALANGNTTLTVGSTYGQYFTGSGSTFQVIVLPVASTMVLGQQFRIVNLSTGTGDIQINSSGGQGVVDLAAGTSAIVTCILTSGTTASSWSATYYADIVASGKKLTVSNSLTLTGTDGSSIAFGTGGTVLYGNQTITLTGDVTGSGATSIATTVAKIAGTVVSGTTGSTNVVFSTTPTLITPILGVATATSINGNTFTTGTYTLTGAAGKTLTFSNSITLAGTDATTMTFPTTTATVARTDAGQTFTGVNTFTSPKIITQISDTNGNILVNIGATASAVNYVKITNAATGTAGPILSSDGETNVDLKVAAKGTGGIHATTGSYGDITADTDGATITFNCATSNIHSVTLGGNRTLAVSNDKVGQMLLIRLKQDATGTRTVTWFSGISWQGGSPPTLTTTGGKTDSIVILVITAGSAYAGYVAGQNE